MQVLKKAVLWFVYANMFALGWGISYFTATVLACFSTLGIQFITLDFNFSFELDSIINLADTICGVSTTMLVIIHSIGLICGLLTVVATRYTYKTVTE